MHPTLRRCLSALALAGLAALPLAGAAAAPWQQVPIAGPIDYALPDGRTRTVAPSCVGGPVRTRQGYKPADTRFSFFVQRGDPRRLLIAFDGGGACWNADTCLTAALAGQATYAMTVSETPASLARKGGILGSDDARNPFRDYTKVFVPYCTADVHWGSADTTYTARLLGRRFTWTLRHRGTDNLLGVLDWLRRSGPGEAGIDLAALERLTIAGASAGGYGAMLAFAYASPLAPAAAQSLVADAAAGVLTASFYRSALYSAASPSGAAWNVAASLPAHLPHAATLLADAAAAPSSLVPLWYQSLAALSPQARFAFLTTNLDAVQIEFYALMRGDLLPSLSGPRNWYAGMHSIALASAALPDFRYYIDGGTSHTVLATNGEYYGRDSHALTPAEWLGAMLDGGPWEHLDAGRPRL